MNAPDLKRYQSIHTHVLTVTAALPDLAMHIKAALDSGNVSNLAKMKKNTAGLSLGDQRTVDAHIAALTGVQSAAKVAKEGFAKLAFVDVDAKYNDLAALRKDYKKILEGADKLYLLEGVFSKSLDDNIDRLYSGKGILVKCQHDCDTQQLVAVLSCISPRQASAGASLGSGLMTRR